MFAHQCHDSRLSLSVATWSAIVLLAAGCSMSTAALGPAEQSAAAPPPPVTMAPAGNSAETEGRLALVSEVTRARESCYAVPECPNLEELMALFTPNPRRTEITRTSDVVQLEGADALRADHLRVAQRFAGRRLETVDMQVHGRNVIAFQLNWDPGSTTPNLFTSVFRVEDGKVAHWALVAP